MAQKSGTYTQCYTYYLVRESLYQALGCTQDISRFERLFYDLILADSQQKWPVFGHLFRRSNTYWIYIIYIYVINRYVQKQLTRTLNTDPIIMPIPSLASDTTLPVRQNATNRFTLNGTPTIKNTIAQNTQFKVTCTGSLETVSAAQQGVRLYQRLKCSFFTSFTSCGSVEGIL